MSALQLLLVCPERRQSGTSGRGGAGSLLRIRLAAKKSGDSARLIRYNESIGLIPQAARQHQGYRRYNESDVHTLRFISRARSVGFSLEEVRNHLDLWHDKSRSAAAIAALANRQLTAVYRKHEELRAMQRTLEDLVERRDAGYCLGRQMSARPDQEKLQLIRNLGRPMGGQCATSRVQET